MEWLQEEEEEHWKTRVTVTGEEIGN